MNSNSNYTLRFPRSSREAYGAQANFKSDPDRLVGIVGLVALAFVIGFLVGGA